MKKIRCTDNEFLLDDFCEQCRYFDWDMGRLGGCVKSGKLFLGFTNVFECEDFCHDTTKRV